VSYALQKTEEIASRDLTLSIMLQHKRYVLDMFADELLVTVIQRQTDGWVSWILGIDNTAQQLQQTYYYYNYYYTVSQENIPDTSDSNLNKNYHIVIIFGVNIPDTTYH